MPHRFKVQYAYAGGYLASIQDDTGNVLGPVLWNLNLLDARFNAVSESYANGLWLQQGFDPLTGLALTRKAGTGGLDDNVQDLAYSWDDGDNLTNRQDLRQGLTETFTYDTLDRPRPLTLAAVERLRRGHRDHELRGPSMATYPLSNRVTSPRDSTPDPTPPSGGPS